MESPVRKSLKISPIWQKLKLIQNEVWISKNSEEMSMEINEDGNGKVTTSSESEEADVDDFEWKIDGDNLIITSDDEVM